MLRSRKPRGGWIWHWHAAGAGAVRIAVERRTVGRRETGALKRLAAGKQEIDFVQLEMSRSTKEHANQRISGEGLIRSRCLELG